MSRAPVTARTREPAREHDPPKSGRSAAQPFLALVDGLRPKVEARLEAVLGEELRTAHARGAPLAAMIKALGDLTMRGGKRLRAGLVLIGYREAAPRGALGPAIEACVALELLQSYLLIHDDWMDHDRVRRGGPAAHVALEKRLGSAHLGAASAILAGDYGSALATRVLTELKISPERITRVVRCFSGMELDVVSGQQLDMAPGTHPVEAVYALKTASYSVRGPLHLGALVAGGGLKVLRDFDSIAQPLGVAFQHRDDLLGTFGDQSVTGKPIGNDLRQGKRTALAVLAAKRLRGRSRAVFDATFANPRASERQVRATLRVLEETGCRAQVEARVTELVAEARLHVRDSALAGRTKVLLESAIAALVDRSA